MRKEETPKRRRDSGPGRPDFPSHRRVTFFLSDSLYDDLKQFATQPTSKTDLVRDAITKLLTSPQFGGFVLNESALDADKLDYLIRDTRQLFPGIDFKPLPPPSPTVSLNVGVFAPEQAPSERAHVIGAIAGDLVARIFRTPEDIFRISPEEFEQLVMDRLAAMRYVVKQVGKTNQPDGGIDIVFSPRPGDGLPFLGAVQVKHHARPDLRSGVEVVHSMVGVLERHRGKFNLGMVVTNTSFTQEAQWFVEPLQLFLRLRDGSDVRRWVAGDFANPRERREFPTSIELTSKLILEFGGDKKD
jgi:hypothetical protein